MQRHRSMGTEWFSFGFAFSKNRTFCVVGQGVRCETIFMVSDGFRRFRLARFRMFSDPPPKPSRIRQHFAPLFAVICENMNRSWLALCLRPLRERAPLLASQEENEWPREDHTNPFAQPERTGIVRVHQKSQDQPGAKVRRNTAPDRRAHAVLCRRRHQPRRPAPATLKVELCA
jgi:hypothetical protein